MKPLLCLMIPLLLFSSCYKDYSVEGRPQSTTQNTVDTTLTDSSYFYDMVIDGKREFHISGKDGYGGFLSGIALRGPNDSAIGFMSIDGPAQGRYGGIPSFMLYRGAIFSTATDTTFDLRKRRVVAGVTPGEYPYTAQPYVLSGVWFTWFDRQDKEWRTNWGSGNQHGSHFTIITTTPVYHPIVTGFLIGVLYYCTFNCTLYDGNGNSIKVEKGRLRYGLWI